MRRQVVCTVWVCRSSMPCRSTLWLKWRATSNYIANALPKGIRWASWRSSARPPTGAERRLRLPPIPKFLVPTQSLSLRACSVLRGQKPIYLRAWKFVGAAMRNWPAQMCLPKRCFNSPAVCPTICVSSLVPAPVPQPNSSPERRIFPTHKGVLNGRFHGPYIRTVPIAGIATPSPRPMAVRMKRACALRLQRDCAPLVN